jgi:TRAP-type C4-dicarboxylate transport system permease small subunit
METEPARGKPETPTKSSKNLGRLLYRVFYEFFLVKISSWLFVIGGVLLVSEILTVIIDSGSRYLPWPNPFQGGALELEELQMGMLSAFVLGFTWYLKGHIRIELLRERMKPRMGAGADTLAGLCGLLYSAGASWGIFKTALENRAIDARTDMLQIPVAPFQFIFAAVFMHFSIVFLAYTIRSIHRIFHPSVEELE